MTPTPTTNFLKPLLVSLLVVTNMTGFAFAQSSGTRNGNGDPALAYTKEQLTQFNLQAANMDYLRLTPADIARRDKQLAPIYKYYNEQSIGRVAAAIQKTWGTNVFHHIYTVGKEVKNQLSTKEGVMAALVYYYTNFVEYDGGNSSSEFSHLAKYNSAPEGEIAYRGLVRGYKQEVEVSHLAGKRTTIDRIKTPFALTSTGGKGQTEHDWLGGLVYFSTNYHYSYTTTTRPLFAAPSIDEFFQAMRESNLKALDATVVFTTSENYIAGVAGQDRNQQVDQPVVVIYPQSSRRVPIPHPVIFISKNAKKSDILPMLEEHAPMIFAYNRLFNETKLPTIAELNSTLEQYPLLLEATRKMKKDTSAAQSRAALMAGFLKVNYTLLAAGAVPVALAGMAAAAVFSPLLAPAILVSTVVVVH